MLRLRKAVYGVVNAPKKKLGSFETITCESGIHILRVRSVCLVLAKLKQVRGVIGVHVDDSLGGGDEVLDRTLF